MPYNSAVPDSETFLFETLSNPNMPSRFLGIKVSRNASINLCPNIPPFLIIGRLKRVQDRLEEGLLLRLNVTDANRSIKANRLSIC